MAKTATTPKPAAKPRTATQTRNTTSKLASEIRHLDGCPKERSEEYEAKRPQSAGGDAITVARCIDCGASNVE